MTFVDRIQAGVAVVNGGTYGSEPHMPFGGLRQSGNGWREAGTEALDVYSDRRPFTSTTIRTGRRRTTSGPESSVSGLQTPVLLCGAVLGSRPSVNARPYEDTA